MKKTLIGLGIAFISIAVVFQNCGSEVSFQEGATSENPFGYGVTRSISLDPNLAENRPPIQLNTIVDNSNSTKDVQDDMIAGFTNAIDQVQGFNVVAQLHTTSHQPNLVPKDADYVKIKSSTSLQQYVTYGNGQTIADKDDVPPNTSYVERKNYTLVDSWFQTRGLLKYDFNSGNFANFKSQYTSAIENLGTGGVADELGLCTLVRQIENNRRVTDPENKAFHLYVLATNEDDFTTLSNCPIEKFKETTITSTTKNENCNASDPDCRFGYEIAQNDTVEDVAIADYTYNESKVTVSFDASRIKEVYGGKKHTGSSKISYQRRRAKYTYKVLKNCPNDNRDEPCASPTEKNQTINGATCSGASASYSACGSLESQARSALGIAAGDRIYSCEAKCTEDWQNQNLPDNKVPGRYDLCSGNTSTTNNCRSADLNEVVSHTGYNASNIRSCERKCTYSAPYETDTDYDQRETCDDPNPSAAQIAAKVADELGVSASEVHSTTYSCDSEDRGQDDKNLKSDLKFSGRFSCDTRDTRTCNSNDLAWLADNRNVQQGNISNCHVKCELDSKSGSVDITNQVGSCPANCNDQIRTWAAQDFGGSLANVASCNMNCTTQTTTNPICTLTAQPNNLCSDTATVASLCAGQGRNNLNMASCSQKSGSKIVEQQTTTTGSEQTVQISDLTGVNAGTLPEMVADRLKAVHGGNGFFTSFFVHSSNPQLNCVAPANYSNGDKYEAVASALGANNASVFPVCLNDYSPALDSVIKIAIESVLTTFNLDIRDNETVYEVEAEFLDGSKEIIPENEYQVFKKTINFNSKDLLKDVKLLNFRVWSPE